MIHIRALWFQPPPGAQALVGPVEWRMLAKTTPLSSLHAGQSARIDTLHFNVEFTARLRALGVEVGKTVRVLRQASWGGPLHLGLGMTEVMLRRADAQSILVTPLDA